MDVRFITTAQASPTLQQLMRDYTEWYWCVAWGSANPLSKKLLPNSKRLRQIVFGTHFYQTEPALLRLFVNHSAVRVAPSTGGTFHPKIYYFSRGSSRAALVGSNNFTMGGMKTNREAAVLLVGRDGDQIFRDIRTDIDGAWERANQIDDAFLAWYDRCHAATRRARNTLTREPFRPKPTRRAKHPKLLDLPWADYSRLLKGAKKGHLAERRELMREARYLFSSAACFSDLTLNARKALAGFLGDSQRHRAGLSPLGWGWFGRMQGAGTFKEIVIHYPKRFDSALQAIPTYGDVTEDDLRVFGREFRNAFSGMSRSGSYATASRLLAMKRPDQFLCVNKENIEGLANDLGFARTTLDMTNYWDRVIAPLRQAKWWTSEKPMGTDGDLWESRMAMLDALYYKP